MGISRSFHENARQAFADFVTYFSQVFDKVERLKARSELHAKAPPIRLITQCETAIGLLNLRAICEMDSEEVSESMSLSHEAVMFGGDDFAASIGRLCFLQTSLLLLPVCLFCQINLEML
jgi:hypothetical protein